MDVMINLPCKDNLETDRLAQVTRPFIGFHLIRSLHPHSWLVLFALIAS